MESDGRFPMKGMHTDDLEAFVNNEEFIVQKIRQIPILHPRRHHRYPGERNIPQVRCGTQKGDDIGMFQSFPN